MKRAFSLVELSIVIVIIGLVVGGISVGKSLIRSASLKGVLTDYALYHGSVQQFVDKYSELPGDFSRAESLWGQQAAGVACKTTASTGKETCNGNGDGEVKYSYANSNEMFRFWQHLSNAGMIEGHYNGVIRDGASNDYVSDIGTNSPKFSRGVGWSCYSMGIRSGWGQWFDDDYGTTLFFGREVNYTAGVAMTPQETKDIDDKIDDGYPGQGDVLAWKNSINPNCTTTEVAATSEYNLDYEQLACSLMFKTGY